MIKHRPNIVVINPDQMRADSLSHLGCAATHTQRLDALAQEGLSFDGAFCQNPVCTPSRCSFMSGMVSACCRASHHVPYDAAL